MSKNNVSFPCARARSSAYVELHAWRPKVRGVQGFNIESVLQHRRREAQVADWRLCERNSWAKVVQSVWPPPSKPNIFTSEKVDA